MFKISVYCKLMNLKEKFDLYKTLCEQNHMDKNGFVMYTGCDSLLFSCLTNIGLNQKFNVLAARQEDGMWLRRPPEYGFCWPNRSESSISKDALLGLLFYIWRSKDLKLANELYEYGKKNYWIMGKGNIVKIYMTPGLQATLAEIIYRLGGKNYLIRRCIPQIHTKTNGCAAHLDIIHMMLREELLGKMIYKKWYQYHYFRQPNNPLFAFLYGNFNKAYSILMNERYFPNNRLPTNKDRFEEWLMQRDFEDRVAWKPAPDHDKLKEFSGGDYLFVAGIILQKYFPSEMK